MVSIVEAQCRFISAYEPQRDYTIFQFHCAHRGVCVCSRSMQVSECVNRVGFQVAFRVTLHYYLQPGNKSQPRQFHACNAVSVTSVLAIVNTKHQQQQQQRQEQQTE